MTTALRSMLIMIVELPQQIRITSHLHAKRQELFHYVLKILPDSNQIPWSARCASRATARYSDGRWRCETEWVKHGRCVSLPALWRYGLTALSQQMRESSYRPRHARRTYILKANGKMYPLTEILDIQLPGTARRPNIPGRASRSVARSRILYRFSLNRVIVPVTDESW